MDKSLEEKSDRQTERMLHALRERHRLLAQCERPVGMAKVRVTLGRIPRATAPQSYPTVYARDMCALGL